MRSQGQILSSFTEHLGDDDTLRRGLHSLWCLSQLHVKGALYARSTALASAFARARIAGAVAFYREHF